MWYFWPMVASLRDTITQRLALLYRRWAIPRVSEGVGDILGAARATMQRKRYCLLATAGDGDVDARVLQPFPPDRDFTVWLGTHRGSRKVEQIRRNPAATLAYQDDAHQACVVLVGRMEIVEDLAARQRRFRPLWHAFWPGGPAADDFLLLRFEPNRIEVWDARRRITPAPFGLSSAKIRRGADGAWVKA